VINGVLLRTVGVLERVYGNAIQMAGDLKTERVVFFYVEVEKRVAFRQEVEDVRGASELRPVLERDVKFPWFEAERTSRIMICERCDVFQTIERQQAPTRMERHLCFYKK